MLKSYLFCVSKLSRQSTALKTKQKYASSVEKDKRKKTLMRDGHSKLLSSLLSTSQETNTQLRGPEVTSNTRRGVGILCRSVKVWLVMKLIIHHLATNRLSVKQFYGSVRVTIKALRGLASSQHSLAHMICIRAS